MTLIPESDYEDFESYVDLDDLPVYEECAYCGWTNLADEGFCGYCAEDFTVY